MAESRPDHMEPVTLLDVGVVSPQLATEQFNISSFFQGIPGNDGLPGTPGLPAQIVDRAKRRRGRNCLWKRFNLHKILITSKSDTRNP